MREMRREEEFHPSKSIVSPAEAMAIQQELRHRVVREARLGPVGRVAGVDVGIREGQAVAAVVVLDFPNLEILETSKARLPVTFPYIPGLLSFRELPVLLDAFRGLHLPPDLVLVDGQGIAHPRRLGIASHLGVVLDIPTIGCAKSRLIGREEPLEEEAGSTALLKDGDEVIGAVVRTQTGRRPLYVSIGHRVDLPTAVHYTLACIRRHRLPEPTRQAHLAAR